jgi:hypothetical protein
VEAMRLLLAVAAVATSAPIPHTTLLAIDGRVVYRNFLPTRMLTGFTYRSWSYKAGVLRVEFRNKSNVNLQWRVESMTGTCDAGKQQSFQLGGNKVWWSQQGAEQVAWRCVFDLAGKPVRLAASSTASTTKLGPAGLGFVAAHAKRY